jgi:myo-inositol-1(or 4)-monophosphatase
MDYRTLCQTTVEIAKEAGTYIFSRLNSITLQTIETKGLNNFVTEVDKATEVLIVSRLKKLVDGAGFIAEKDLLRTGDNITESLILTEPRLFIPPVAISIALVNGEPVIGVVVNLAERAFYAWKGSAVI